MADIVRLKNWRTFLMDGKSSVTYSTASKNKVCVFVQVGSEPLKPNADLSDTLNVDDVIVAMAKHIQARRKAKK